MAKLKILFVCKYNRFRSRVAEAYLKKINSSVAVSSGGLIRGFSPLNEDQVQVAREFDLDIVGEIKNISMDDLFAQDKIIILADDIPASIFDYKDYKDKVEVWSISDTVVGDSLISDSRNIIMEIIKKVDLLNQSIIGGAP